MRPFSGLRPGGTPVLELALVVAVASVGVADRFTVRPKGVMTISGRGENHLLQMALVEHDVMTFDDASRACNDPFGAHMLTLTRELTPDKVRAWLTNVTMTSVWLGGRSSAALGDDLEPGFPGSVHNTGTQCVSFQRGGATGGKWMLTSTSCQSRLPFVLCRLPPDSPHQTFSTSHAKYHVFRDNLRDYRQGASHCCSHNLTGLANLTTTPEAQKVVSLLMENRYRAQITPSQWLWVSNTSTCMENSNSALQDHLCLALHIHGEEDLYQITWENCTLRLATLCQEIQGPNVAFGKHVYASSVDSSSSPSELAATDNRLWTFKATRAQIKPWIAVDLGFQYDVTAVTVTFSHTCTDAFHIIFPKVRGMKSVCIQQYRKTVRSVEECMELACMSRIGVFNYRAPDCILTCQPLHIMSDDGPGWDIYYNYNATVMVTVQDELGTKDEHVKSCDVIMIDGLTRSAPHVATCPAGTRGQYVQLEVKAGQARVLDVAEVNVKGTLARHHSLGMVKLPCVFPFLFNNTYYHKCTSTPAQPDVGWSWCAVVGPMIDGSQSTNLIRPCLHVRLVAGRTQAEGLLETTTNGTWWRVTSEGWTDRHAHIVCRQLGYKSGKKVPEAFFPSDGAAVVRFEWSCDSNNTILDTCSVADQGGSQPLQWTHTYENVGAVCDEGTDSPMMVGLPTFSRSRVDECDAGFAVMSQKVQSSGLLVSWTVYFTRPSVTISVFILRSASNNYTNKAAMRVITSESVGVHTLYLKPQEQTLVFPGDIIAFEFKSGNPVPYDVVETCNKTPHFSLYQVSVNSADQSITLTGDDEVKPSCRFYSLYASITKSASPFSTLWNGSKYTAIGQTLRYRDAVRSCSTWEGVYTTLLTVSSVQEYTVLNDWLSMNKSQPNYWVIADRDSLQQDGRTLPGLTDDSAAMPGCNILHRSDTRRKFVFDVADCSSAYPVICEQALWRPPKTEPQVPTNQTEAPLPSNDYVEPTKWQCHLAIGFGIIGVFALVISVIIFVFMRWRYRCHLFWRKSFLRERRDSESTLAVLSPAAMEPPCS